LVAERILQKCQKRDASVQLAFWLLDFSFGGF
jgi:hypothetical protein